MDTLQRKIVRPSRIGLELPASAAPLGLPDVPEKISLNADLEFLTERKVCYGDIDQNMHMNNARYCAWINDLLPLSFHRENWLSQVHIAFHKEQGDGQSVRISGAFDETGAFVVKGEEGETLTFAAELRYQKRSA
jgi:acyl-ACP thioesterase